MHLTIQIISKIVVLALRGLEDDDTVAKCHITVTVTSTKVCFCTLLLLFYSCRSWQTCLFLFVQLNASVGTPPLKTIADI